MVFKFSELRIECGLTFATDAERQAYKEARQAASAERIAEKVEQLKALYYSDPVKYKKFEKFTDDDWENYAKLCLRQQSANKMAWTFRTNGNLELDPEIAEWAQFSYEEILDMEANGVLIPDEVLAWAHSMQDNDVTSYEIGEDSEDELNGTGENSASSELKEMQKKTRTLSEKSETTKNEMNATFEEFKKTSKKAEEVKREQETTKKDSLKKIEDLTDEWKRLTEKVKKGSKLSEAERNRYKELGALLNGKDGELMSDILASTDELQELIDSMDGLEGDIADGIDLGDETTAMATELALYEKGYESKNLSQPGFMTGATGVLKDLLYGATGQTIARDALDNGNNLIEFSNTLSNTLMMNQYASLYEFAETFTTSSSDTIDEAKESMGADFNKTSKEISEEIDALPEMSAAEEDLYNLQQQGVGLIGQARFFRSKSKIKTAESLKSIKELKSIEKQAEKEENKSQKLTDALVSKMEDKKEEADELTEKKEKAEEKQKTAENLANARSIDDLKEAENLVKTSDEDEFTEEDQDKLDQLNSELEKAGLKGQRKLFQSLSRIEGLADLLENTTVDGLDTIDYGEIAQGLGLEIIKKHHYGWIFTFFYMIGITTLAAGTNAIETGNENNDKYNEAIDKIDESEASVGENQTAIENLTNVDRISTGTKDDSGEEETAAEGTGTSAEETSADETSAVTSETSGGTASDNNAENTEEAVQNINNTVGRTADTTATGSTTTGTTSGTGTTGESTGANSVESTAEGADEAATAAGESDKTESSDNKKKDQETSTDEAQETVDNLNQATADENEDTLEKTDETEKTQKEIEKEMKNLQKQMNKDNKQLEKIIKESLKIAQEKERLADEFEELNTENEEIAAKQESQQAEASASGAEDGQGGLGDTQQTEMAVSGDDTSTIETNQARQVQISAIFKNYDQKLNTNQTKVRKISTTSRKRRKKFDKLAKQRQKMIQDYQKAEEKKQAKVAKSLAVIGVQNNIFSVTLSVGSALCLWPPTEPVGSVMVTVGTYGMASCQATKALVLIASGNFQAGIMAMASAVITIATSMIGAGAAGDAVANGVEKAAETTASTLSKVITTTASTLNTVSAVTDTVAQVNTLQGKEASGWLNTISQISGAAGAVASVAGGFSDSKVNKDTGELVKKSTFASSTNGLAKAAQIVGAVGQTASATATISTLIKQAQGEDAGKFEAILGIVGYSMSTAGAVIGMAGSISGKKEKTDDTNNPPTNNPNNPPDETQKNDGTDETTNEDNKDKTNENSRKDDTLSVNPDGSVSTFDGTPPVVEEQAVEATKAIEEAQNGIDTELTEQIKEGAGADETGRTETADSVENTAAVETDSEKSTFKKIGKAVKSAFSKVKDFAKNTFSKIKTFVSTATVKIKDFAKNAFNKVKDFTQNTVKKLKDTFKGSETSDNCTPVDLTETSGQGTEQQLKQITSETVVEKIPEASNDDNIENTETENITKTTTTDKASTPVDGKEMQELQDETDKNIAEAEAITNNAQDEQPLEQSDVSTEDAEEVISAAEETAETPEKETPEKDQTDKTEEKPDDKKAEEEESKKTEKAEEKRKKTDKFSEIAGGIGQVTSNGTQLIAAIEQLANLESEVEAKTPSWDMSKGKSLMRKIKRRREGLISSYQARQHR